MAKIFKKIGRFFVLMNQRNTIDIRQSVLLVDGNFILPNNFALIIRGVKEKFKNARIEVLTSQNKNEFLRDNFPDVDIIIPEPKTRIERFNFCIQLLRLLRSHYDYIVLSSLDMMPAAVCLLFGGSRIFLHNRWLEWHRLHFKTIGNILNRRAGGNKNYRKTNSGIKYFLKYIGRKFVILQDIADDDIKSNILIVDNGYIPIDHVLMAVKRTEEVFVDPNITILTFAKRRHYFMNEFAHAKVTAIADSAKRPMLTLAWKMFGMHRDGFRYIVLTTLDILPAAVALELNAKKVLLYNRWHQWWSLKFRNFQECLRDTLKLIIGIPVTLYLLIASGFILLRTFIRARFINVKKFSGG